MSYKPLTAIIFDMDGTLANTEEIHRQAFNESFREFDLPIDWEPDEYARLLSVSGGRQRIYNYLKKHNLGNRSDKLDFAREIHNRKSEIYRNKLKAGHLPLRRGVLRLIREARKNRIRMGIATSSSLKNIHTLINTTIGSRGLKYFDSIVSCDLISEQKPSPAAYQFALAELGANPENCIAIEDTTNGNRAALAAGIKTIITTHEFTVDSDFTGASLVLDDMGEPEHSFNVLSGENHDHRYLDLELMRKILVNGTMEPGESVWDLAYAACSK